MLARHDTGTCRDWDTLLDINTGLSKYFNMLLMTPLIL